MKKTALVVMAAGIGSRFGGGIKQLEPVGPNGEIIMDYSIYDAMEAGFNKVVFIIRKDLEKDFKEIIGNRIEKLIEVEYAFQELDNLPEGFEKPEGRTKPWGTGQAVLSCKGLIKEPFAVINADDYYGKEAFVKVHDYLVEEHEATDKFDFCMAGFILGNTLSDNGAVARGICQVENGYLTDVVETGGIEKLPGGGAGGAEYRYARLDRGKSVTLYHTSANTELILSDEEELKIYYNNKDEHGNVYAVYETETGTYAGYIDPDCLYEATPIVMVTLALVLVVAAALIVSVCYLILRKQPTLQP